MRISSERVPGELIRVAAKAVAVGVLVFPLQVLAGGMDGTPPEVPIIGEVENYTYKEISFGQLWLDGRPADFYRLTYDGAPEVCGQAIEALNEPHRPPDGATHKVARILLESRLSVDWADLEYEYRNEVARANADLFWDGDSETVYRFIHSYANFASHFFFWKSEVDRPISEFADDQLMTLLKTRGEYQRGDISKREMSELWLDQHSVQQLLHPEEPQLGFWADIAEFDARHYVLVVNASYPMGIPISGFVIKMVDGAVYENLCAFRTNFVLSPPPSKEKESD